MSDKIIIPASVGHQLSGFDDPNTGAKVLKMADSGPVSDGWHSFAELYEYRMLYNAALFNEWANQFDELAETRKFDVHKSWKHSDGQPCFGGGWFVVVAQLPTGQITNHYHSEFWDLFKVPARDTAAEYDNHTPAQVAERLNAYLKGESGA